MGKKNVLSSNDGEDKEESSGEHEKNQNGEGQSEEERKHGMDVSQPHDGNIPEYKDQKKEDQAGDD
jgi:hypothetical protein